MNYNSTRDKNRVVTASQAIAQGISEEGGLFVPQEFPNSRSILLKTSRQCVNWTTGAGLKKSWAIFWAISRQRKSMKA